MMDMCISRSREEANETEKETGEEKMVKEANKDGGGRWHSGRQCERLRRERLDQKLNWF